MATKQFDLIIIGGGMVGASLAAALDQSGLRIAVVEKFATDDEQQPGYDERTVALTWSARQIFEGIGVWGDIEQNGAEPIRDIHISNRGHFGATHLACDDVGTEALGYVVPTRVIGRVLGDRLSSASSVTMFQPAEAQAITPAADSIEVVIDHDGRPATLSASLCILADGGRSALANSHKESSTPYSQQALLCIVSSDRPHNGRAYERFTDEGPLALLPHSRQRYAVVWTGEMAQVQTRLELDDDRFLAALQSAFGDRAGNFTQPGARKAYPLSRSQLSDPAGNRTLTIGNAAHTVHPVAGQGFNLSLRDVAWLAERLFDAHRKGEDIGSAELLARFVTERKREASRVGQFTHGLISVFSNSIGPLGLARNAALSAIEHLPFAKRMLLKRTMGMAGRASALASGSARLSGHDK